MNTRIYLTAAWLLLALSPLVMAEEDSPAGPAEEQEEKKAEDGKAGGKFLPIPIVITEPAIGEGLGAALVYFHADPGADKKRLTTAAELNRVDRKQTPPPTATGVFAAYTNNETTAFGIGHSRTFKEDTWRLTALLADAKIIATYYVSDVPFDFSLEGAVAFARVKRRFGDSNFFLGLATSYLDADITFPLDPIFGADDDPLIPGLGFNDVGASASIGYDSRDDTMMPTTGWLAELSGWHYDEGLGGDFTYSSATLNINSFHKLGKKFVLGWRLEGTTASGNYPFYSAPYVKLRGIPALRYQGKSASAAEIELRYELAERWAILGFSGRGWTDERNLADETENSIDTVGFGVRWLALPTKNVWIGIDVAQGPEEKAYYFQMVHPW
ncbi:MAG: BamA/TamA family outer membrane protein [Woeseiaceae bacterium]